jgi:hypothetical protein
LGIFIKVAIGLKNTQFAIFGHCQNSARQLIGGNLIGKEGVNAFRPSWENPCPGVLAKGSGALPVWAEAKLTPASKPATTLANSNFFMLSPFFIGFIAFIDYWAILSLQVARIPLRGVGIYPCSIYLFCYIESIFNWLWK